MQACSRRQVIGALGMALATFAHADGYPSKPVKLIVVVSPGGSADAVARLVAERLSPRLGQSVIVENRPGAGGNIATQAVARSPADGYTLLVSSNNHTINPVLFANAGYAIDDLVPIVELMRGPSVIVVPANSSYKKLGDLLADAKRRPGAVAYGSAGIGIASHVAGEMLQKSSGVQLAHIPYKGSGPSLTDAMGGQVPVVISSLVAASPHIQSGSLRALAVTSGARWPTVPQIPAASETVPGYSHMTWLGLFAPKGTPLSVIQKLNADVQAVLADAETRSKFEKLGGNVVLEDQAQFDRLVRKEFTLSTKLVADTGMRAD